MKPLTELPPNTIPDLSPILFYEDLSAAIVWLTRVFGFKERKAETIVADDGPTVHAELTIGQGMIILSTPYDDFEAPQPGAVHHHCLYVSIQNVTAHRALASKSGADGVSELRQTDYGALVYSAKNLAGYRWIFAEDLTRPNSA